MKMLIQSFLHMLEAIIRAEGAGAQFQMLDTLPADWEPPSEP